MSTEIKVPPMGESITEATVASWHKNVGEAVKEGEILVELETDKVTMEVPSPKSGVLKQIIKQTGETVRIDEVLAILEDSVTSQEPTPTPKPTEPKKEETQQVEMAPSAKRLVMENNLDPSKISGTGKHGQITKEDVIYHLEKKEIKQEPKIEVQQEVKPAITEPKREEIVPMSRLRQRIAERLVEAQHTAAILTTFNEADMSKIMEYREKYNEIFQKKYGIKLGFMSFFVKACVQALKEFPAVNAEIRDKNIVYKYYYDIGVAVGGPRGLVVPVVRNADKLSFAEIELEIARLAQKVREGTITLEELSGGTFTISNGGIYGSMMSTPILNPPQVGILGMHNIVKRAVVVNDQIVIRPMMYLALSYDHRIIDGKEAVSFLVRVKECVENPERMMFEI
jgi:2-oxoglutarate dehydrogenase E2 component (dihydrolipoamide succinyltransferase)